MIKKIALLFVAALMYTTTQAQENPTVFSEKALNDTFITLDGDSVSFQSILEKHQGKMLFIEVWASWCSDCIKGMPKVKELQKEYEAIDFVFLSLDKSIESWKKGIDKYEVKGEHYFMQSGWKGDFGTFLKLDWIPRYMVVDEKGNIKIYKAIKADDTNLKSVLK
ncbi:TlpA family protein disulfide reductase [Mangrovimonas sp. CR14]|uniref:TlpA family protein disulfide reductase n=1 Tax=Mangrovimonas sp. CR14 TaxID=2706120 RepID=UPI0014204BAA|nr:TlpA disulfide reductase family protein [Mangrovimonas sp. CR14]NIK92242.1 TlpA family protein disulfide reductase [Mangrovimonas sp. CR14]